jgi:hypothetical protein
METEILMETVIDTSVPTSARVIGYYENPKWQPRQHLVTLNGGTTPDQLRDSEFFVQVPRYINQLSDSNFTEFEEKDVVSETGYCVEDIRAHACGISSLYMAISALNKNTKVSVGELTIKALEMHRNDLKENDKLVKRGTPVFNLKNGWYHDALIYIGQESGIEGVRTENQTVETVAAELNRNNIELNTVSVAVLSLDNSHWRLPDEPKSSATHMVVVSGAKFDSEGELKELCVTDPYAPKGEPKVNQWVPYDERFRSSFTGKAMIFQKREIEEL